MAIERHVGESDGIYGTESIGPFRHDSPAEDMEVLHELIKRGNDLDGILADMESHAHEVLKAHGLTYPWKTEHRQLGDILAAHVAGDPAAANDLEAYNKWTGEFVAALSSGPPILKTAERFIAEAGNLRRLLAGQTSAVQSIARQAFRVGRRYEQLAVRPFAALVRKAKGRVIHRNGRSCIVTDFEHRIVEYMDHRTEAPLADFVKHVWGDHYNKKNQNRYAKALSVFNSKLSESGIPVSLSIRDDRLIRDLPKPA